MQLDSFDFSIYFLPAFRQASWRVLLADTRNCIVTLSRQGTTGNVRKFRSLFIYEVENQNLQHFE